MIFFVDINNICKKYTNFIYESYLLKLRKFLKLRRSEKPENRLPRLTLYTKHPCPLCDELKEQLEPFYHRVCFEEIDISLEENKRWKKLYQYEIPVLFLENRFLCKNRLNEDVLERNLSDLENEWRFV